MFHNLSPDGIIKDTCKYLDLKFLNNFPLQPSECLVCCVKYAILNSVHYLLISMQYVPGSVQGSVCSVQCAVSSVQCPVFNAVGLKRS